VEYTGFLVQNSHSHGKKPGGKKREIEKLDFPDLFLR